MKHKFSVSLSLALVLAMLVTSLAVADNVENDIIADPASISLQAGVAASYVDVQFYVQPTSGSGDPDQQCNFDAPTEEVTFTINTPAGVTANPASLTFDECKDGGDFNYQSVRFSANASAVSGNISFTETNNSSGGTFKYDNAVFYINVTTPPPSDTTPPVITPSVSGTLGNNGWYVSDVTVSWTVVDDESAISSTSGCDTTTINSDTAGTILTCSAISAGGTNSASITIKRDATNPEVSLVGGPANGGSYYFGFVPAEPTCDASDVTSGLDGVCSVSGYGDTVGNHTVTASAFDNAGNEGTDSASYTVLAWELFGFYRPVEMGGVWNTVKGGSTVPLKFNVFAGATELTEVGVVKSFTAVKVACEAGGDEDPVDFTTTGGTSLRYDWADGQFIQNWKTPKTLGCYRVAMTTQDLSTIIAFFKLK